MIKALYNFFGCNNNIEPQLKYSFIYDKYDSEEEAYVDIKNVDINIGVNEYTTKKIMSAYEKVMQQNDNTYHFLKYFLGKFFNKNSIKESIVYIQIDDKLIRIRNITLKNQRVLKLIIDK